MVSTSLMMRLSSLRNRWQRTQDKLAPQQMNTHTP